MSHTKAPWRLEASTKTIRSVPANYWIASMDSWDGAVDHEANGRLIAAAPELLASCIELLNCINTDRDWEEGKRARAAIAKARGEQS